MSFDFNRFFVHKVREAWLRLFGRVQRRNSEYTGQRMLRIELQGRKKRGRAQKVHGCSGEGRAR